MSIIAGGKLHRIAPNADMYLVKTKNQYKDKFGGSKVFTGSVYPEALEFATRGVKNHIRRSASAESSKQVRNQYVLGYVMGSLRDLVCSSLTHDIQEWLIVVQHRPKGSMIYLGLSSNSATTMMSQWF
jgi:hypothetical protein